jgi:hypothetical protein
MQLTYEFCLQSWEDLFGIAQRYFDNVKECEHILSLNVGRVA